MCLIVWSYQRELRSLVRPSWEVWGAMLSTKREKMYPLLYGEQKVEGFSSDQVRLHPVKWEVMLLIASLSWKGRLGVRPWGGRQKLEIVHAWRRGDSEGSREELPLSDDVQVSLETICLSIGLCLRETDGGWTAYGYQNTMLRKALTTYIDEAFKNSLWPTATWHHYSKWLILPRLGRHLQVHSDVCSGSGSD